MKTFLFTIFIVLLLSIIGCDARYGFVESELKLSAESKLPKFIPAIDNIKPSDELVNITIYSNPFGAKAKVVVLSKYNTKQILYNKIGNFKWHPSTENQFNKSNRYDVYPQYFIININNVEETFIKRTKNDIVYVVDGYK